MYVYSGSVKSLMATVVLIVESTELVNSNTADSELSIIEGGKVASVAIMVEESVIELEVDMSVPVPVSSCALA
jgi:hypothetical protein